MQFLVVGSLALIPQNKTTRNKTKITKTSARDCLSAGQDFPFLALLVLSRIWVVIAVFTWAKMNWSQGTQLQIWSKTSTLVPARGQMDSQLKQWASSKGLQNAKNAQNEKRHTTGNLVFETYNNKWSVCTFQIKTGATGNSLKVWKGTIR